MIDFRQLFDNLIKGVRDANFPDADKLARQLDMDVSTATISKTKRGLLTIYNANLSGGAMDVDVVGSLTPQRMLNLLFQNSHIPYDEVSGERFGDDQRVEQSKHSKGFAILFHKDGLICGLTASGPTGFVDSVFCEAPRLASAGQGDLHRTLAN